MGRLLTLEPPPADYPNHLASPDLERIRLPLAGWLVLGLVLLCLVPRVVMALRIPGVCPDGVLYINLAREIEAGNFRAGLREMGLNVYPIVLAGLHRLGLEWETAAAAWGVVISSLVVLPLWGWVRRQFDDRIALVACLLYAVNPKMIEWSPEVMRDPTFWFVFTLALYWMWRAATEVNWGYYVAAGGAILLAALTRIEGLFLLIPLGLWTFFRWRALQADSRATLARAAACVLAIPAVLVFANLAWFIGQGHWTGMRLQPLARVKPWLAAVTGHQALGDDGRPLDTSMTIGRMMWVFIPTMTRGLSPVFALLMFGGMWGWRRVWARRDHQPLFYAAAVVMCGIWIQLWYGKSICPRYALPIVLMAAGFGALGLLGFFGRLFRAVEWMRGQITKPLAASRALPTGEDSQEGSPGHWQSQWHASARQWHASARRWHASARHPRALAGFAAVAVAAISLADAMTSSGKYFETRRIAGDVGRWLDREYQSPPVLVGPIGITPIVSYYAQGSSYEAFDWRADDAYILGLVARSRADIVMLRPTKELTDERCEALIDRLKAAGLAPVPRDLLPPATSDFIVLARGWKTHRVARSTR